MHHITCLKMSSLFKSQKPMFSGTTLKFVLEQDKTSFIRLIGSSILQSAAYWLVYTRLHVTFFFIMYLYLKDVYIIIYITLILMIDDSYLGNLHLIFIGIYSFVLFKTACLFMVDCKYHKFWIIFIMLENFCV